MILDLTEGFKETAVEVRHAKTHWSSTPQATGTMANSGGTTTVAWVDKTEKRRNLRFADWQLNTVSTTLHEANTRNVQTLTHSAVLSVRNPRQKEGSIWQTQGGQAKQSGGKTDTKKKDT